MHDNKSSSATSKSKVSAPELRDIVAIDKSSALEVIQEARSQVSSFRMIVPQADITGKPDGIAQFARYKRDQLRNLEVVQRSPFFMRVNAEMTLRGSTESTQVLLTEARDIGGVVSGDGWILTTWTSPLGLGIRGAAPGDRVTIEGRSATYEIQAWAKYEELLPRFANGEFRLSLERGAALASEDELDALLAAAISTLQLPPVPYQTKPTFGLSDIVVLVDEPQRAALALPFRQSAIIEGPPGSGKTSVGIMRIAVLYDQQWDELGLKRDRDKPFHDYSSMQVLVYNDEMVEYLKGLAQSIGVEHVHVSTTKDFFRRICRETRLLSGTERRDRPSLSILKGRREALRAYFAGFKAHVARYWPNHQNELRQKLFALGPDFLVFADRLSSWTEKVIKAIVKDDRIVGAVGLSDVLTDAAELVLAGRSPTRNATSAVGSSGTSNATFRGLSTELISERMPEARKIVEASIRSACHRASISKAMFDQPEFDELLDVLAKSGVPERVTDDGQRLWRKQYAGDLPAYSELDLAMSAWLGAKLLLSTSPHRRPWIGGLLERLTHIVIDEAQDLSPSHLAVLASQVGADGTMTLVGDIHQNLNPHAGLQSWDDTGLANMKMAAFAVNHRQTQQLGAFTKGLHEALFAETCPWEPSTKAVGSVPRVGAARSWDELVEAITIEATYWREHIPGSTKATVAVLYDGRMQPKRLKWLKRKLDLAFSEQLTVVEAAIPGTGGEQLRRTDRIIIASVKQTKGLEFDAVVFIEPRPRWSKPVEEIDVRIRNGFYVAASRARAGLSIFMSNLPSCIGSMANSGLCTVQQHPKPD